MQPRYIELDLLRTLAIAGMVIYHTAYDLQMFYGWNIDVFTGGWKLAQITIASLFLLLVGMGAALANHGLNAVGTYDSYVPTWHRAYKRLLKIGAAALLVTIVTYLIDPATYVRFGILHLIAVSALLMPALTFFAQKRRHIMASLPVIGIGLMIIGLAPSVPNLHVDAWPIIFLPLGITYAGFSTVDYFPIIPWFGVILIGYGIGCFAYGRPGRTDAMSWRLYDQLSSISNTWITWPGRHSLAIYLMHQPMIIGILWLILGAPHW